MIFNIILKNKTLKLFLLLYLCISQLAYVALLLNFHYESKKSDSDLVIVDSNDTPREPFLAKNNEVKSFENYTSFSKQHIFFIPKVGLDFQSKILLIISSDNYIVESIYIVNKTNPRSPPNTIS